MGSWGKVIFLGCNMNNLVLCKEIKIIDVGIRFWKVVFIRENKYK